MRNHAVVPIRILLFILAFGLPCAALAMPTFSEAWAIGSGGEQAIDVAADAMGNIYYTGIFSGTMDFDPGSGVTEMTAVGANDLFLLKFSGDGTFLWARQRGSSGTEYARALALDGAGNVFVAGYTNAAFDGETYLGGLDGFVCRFDEDGTWYWTRFVGGSGTDRFEGAAADGSGGVFASGFSDSAAVGGQATNGDFDVLAARVDFSGTATWARLFGTAAGDFAYRASLDAGGGALLAGTTYGSFGGANLGGLDAFYLRITPAGVLDWTRQRGGAGDDYGYDLQEASDGDVVVAGFSDAAFDGQPHGGDWDAVLMRFDGTGSWLWTRFLGTSGFDRFYALALDGSDNAYPAGVAGGALDAQDYAGMQDILTCRYDTAGNRGWLRLQGGAEDDIPFGIAMGGTSTLHTTGVFVPTADFDPDGTMELDAGESFRSSFFIALPAAADGGVAGGKLTRYDKAGSDVNVMWDGGACGGTNAAIFYGDIGDFSGYQGSALCTAGNAGTVTFAPPAGDIWFNLLWTEDGAAGHPGYATAGARTWTASGFCTITTDEIVPATCATP